MGFGSLVGGIRIGDLALARPGRQTQTYGHPISCVRSLRTNRSPGQTADLNLRTNRVSQPDSPNHWRKPRRHAVGVQTLGRLAPDGFAKSHQCAHPVLSKRALRMDCHDRLVCLGLRRLRGGRAMSGNTCGPHYVASPIARHLDPTAQASAPSPTPTPESTYVRT